MLLRSQTVAKTLIPIGSLVFPGNIKVPYILNWRARPLWGGGHGASGPCLLSRKERMGQEQREGLATKEGLGCPPSFLSKPSANVWVTLRVLKQDSPGSGYRILGVLVGEED